MINHDTILACDELAMKWLSENFCLEDATQAEIDSMRHTLSLFMSNKHYPRVDELIRANNENVGLRREAELKLRNVERWVEVINSTWKVILRK